MSHPTEASLSFARDMGIRCILALAASFLAVSSKAAKLDEPVPINAYITLNGYDWAWGSNCSRNEGTGCDTLDFAYQATQGWRIAMETDMSKAPRAVDFLFPGGNVPFNGVDPVSGAKFNLTNSAYTSANSDGACASSYFTKGDGSNACNWFNGSGQNTNTLGWFNQNGESRIFADVIFVRDISPIPEPSAFALLALGFIVVATVAKPRRKERHLESH